MRAGPWSSGAWWGTCRTRTAIFRCHCIHSGVFFLYTNLVSVPCVLFFEVL